VSGVPEGRRTGPVRGWGAGTGLDRADRAARPRARATRGERLRRRFRGLANHVRYGPLMPDRNRRFLLRERPSGRIGPHTFELSEEAAPEIGDGEALVRVDWISLDPTNRLRSQPQADTNCVRPG
jgi:N-terminal domain of oxidoreductase